METWWGPLGDCVFEDTGIVFSWGLRRFLRIPGYFCAEIILFR